MIVLIIVVVLLLIIIGWFVGTYNSLINLRNRVQEAFSTMDVYLKKRYDLIPNVVETVKGYAKHEKSTLENVIKARNSAMSATSADEELAKQGELTQTLGKLFALAEQYPDLKANQNFLELQNQLETVEVDIANARKYYNGSVLQYNNKIQQVPSNIVASLFKFTVEKMYEVDSEEERKNVKVEF
ncbi:MAG: LemA family protein [Bacilli bacterium]|nr:LemA family protein [Bacilli bacterium]